MILIFLQELVLFSLVQVIGILVVLRNHFLVGQNLAVDWGARDIVFFLIFLALFIYFVRRFSLRLNIFFKLILAIAVFAGSQTVFSAVFKEPLISSLIALSFVLLVSSLRVVLLHNLGIVLALAGIGSILGLSLRPISAVFFLLILSFYDIIAVYKTGHMVKMAEDMIKSKAVFGLILPQKFQGWKENLENVRPGEQFMILGSGDVVMPLVLIASVIKAHSLAIGLVILFFSLVGLLITYYLFVTQKTKRPMAALPPIAVMSIIWYLVSVLVF